MKNNAPIILNCFSRGGSNILWNILLTHPDACSPIEETLQIFRFDARAPRWSGLQAVLRTRQLRFFDQWNLSPRRPISAQAQAYIDSVLFDWKMKTVQDDEMRYKAEGVLYTPAEVAAARLVLKNNNGLIFLADSFRAMYPNATFLALVRDPLPLYESHKRHKTPVGASPEAFAAFYNAMTVHMQTEAARRPDAHLLRFEDMLADPLTTARQVYAWCGLEMDKVSKLRFKAKPHIQADGSHRTNYQEGRHYWFAFDELDNMLDPEVNRHQVSKLAPAEIERLRALTREASQSLGYPLA
jgi:hypothetical protein